MTDDTEVRMERSWVRRLVAGLVASALVAATGCTNEGPGGGPGDDPGDGGDPLAGEREPIARDWGDAAGERGDCGLPAPDATVEDFGECEVRTLPGTGAEYCVKAHPDCSTEDAACPLYITLNLRDAYMGRVDEPDRYGRIIVARLNEFGDEPRDRLAELPRVIAEDFAGLDRDRIYALGWSIGSAKLYQGLSRGDYDESPYGTTSDVYAGLANLGGCLKSDGDPATGANFHVIMINGADDPFGNDGCHQPERDKDWARRLAVKNGCERTEVEWENIGADDPLVPGGDGTDIAQRATFGECPGGDVVSYRFRDEEHELSFRRHFEPRVRALEIAWDFFQGRLRPGVEGGVTGPGSACYE